jgi:NAD+ synthase (glutamine-hydrolysing)
VRIAIAQINTRVGDLEANCRRIRLAIEAAAAGGADLAVFPELAVTGYPPRDLLFDPGFVAAAIAATRTLAADGAAGPPAILGTVVRSRSRPPGHPGLENAAVVLAGGHIAAVRSKRLLPAYDVFHEPRWFLPGEPAGPVAIAGRSAGLLLCEDLWDEGHDRHPPRELLAGGADLLIAISASPYRSGILERRLHHARRPGVPIVYANAVGANDELIFDGASFALDERGEVVALLPRFAEALEFVDLPGARPIELAPRVPEAETFAALVLGVRDFAAKNRLRRAFVGLSGGIDSALVACIAREALGAGAVTGVAIPSRYTDPRSTAAAQELAAALGIGFDVVELEPLHAAAEASLDRLLAGDRGTTAENIQARLRAVVLLAHVNRHGGLLLNTSNKTELALGYGTLHGDLAGTLGVIADLTKPEVYALARWYQHGRAAIPAFILERPPAAELFPEQVDPFDYPRVAPLVEALVQGEPFPEGTSAEEAADLRRRFQAAEHKRRQYGIGLKVRERSFGTGRLVPVTRK